MTCLPLWAHQVASLGRLYTPFCLSRHTPVSADETGVSVFFLAIESLRRWGYSVENNEKLIAHSGKVQWHVLCCSAAPIFGPDEELLAVLDASALYSPDDNRSPSLVFRLVVNHALAIENAYFVESFSNYWLLQLSKSRDFVDVQIEYLIAFDPLGFVAGANRKARADLVRHGGATDANIERILDCTALDIIRRSHAMRYASALCGKSVLGREHFPADIVRAVGTKSNGSVSVNRSASGGLKDLKDNADQERKRLVAILAQNKWQVAASARQIGVSRATFYRWMSRHQIVQPNRIVSGE